MGFSSVFQMCLTPAESKEGVIYFGLKFPSEVEVYTSPIWVIPLPDKKMTQLMTQYILPGEIKKKYTNFELRYEGKNFKINHDKIDTKIRFELGVHNETSKSQLTQHRFWPELPPFSSYKYIGNHSDFLLGIERFAVLKPVNILLLNQLYLEKEICFIGATPNFNENNH